MTAQMQEATSNASGLRLIVTDSPSLNARRGQLCLATEGGTIVDKHLNAVVTLADLMVADYNRQHAIDPLDTMPIVTIPDGYTRAEKDEAIELLKARKWDFMNTHLHDYDPKTIYMGPERQWS